MGSQCILEAQAGAMEGPTRAVLFVDLAGFTALTEAHGDLEAADVAARFFALARQCLAGGARVVKTLGDGVLVVAPDVGAAVATVLGLFDAIDREPAFPLARAGIHIGPVVERDDDVFGATVNLAARIAAHACAGEILCTRETAAAAAAPTERVGVIRLRNIVAPVELFKLVLREAVAVDPVCRMALSAGDVVVELTFEGCRVAFCSESCAEKFRAAPGDYPLRSGG
jgi:adenylate cyclase